MYWIKRKGSSKDNMNWSKSFHMMVAKYLQEVEKNIFETAQCYFQHWILKDLQKQLYTCQSEYNKKDLNPLLLKNNHYKRQVMYDKVYSKNWELNIKLLL